MAEPESRMPVAADGQIVAPLTVADKSGGVIFKMESVSATGLATHAPLLPSITTLLGPLARLLARFRVVVVCPAGKVAFKLPFI